MTRAPQLPALQRQRPGTFALLIAATCLLMLLAAALAMSLRTAARGIEDATAQALLVQIVDADPERRAATADEAIALLDRTPGVISSHRVPEREARALIAPYIAGMHANDLPLPAMIEVRARDRAAVTAALRPLPVVEVTAAGAELGGLQRLIGALRGVALGIALAAAGATGLIAMLSARAALAREGATLDILHALGATDRQLSRLVTGKVARDAAIGAAAGLLAAIAIIPFIGARLAAASAAIDTRFGAASWGILLLLAAALVGISVAAAQVALLASLRRAP